MFALFCFFVFSDLGLDWVLFSNTFFDAIIAFTPNKVLLRKTCFLGRKKQTSLLSIYCASGGGFAGGAVHPVIQRWLSSLYPAGFPQGNDSIYAAMHFIDRWFPSKNGHNMSHHPLYRNQSPQ